VKEVNNTFSPIKFWHWHSTQLRFIEKR